MPAMISIPPTTCMKVGVIVVPEPFFQTVRARTLTNIASRYVAFAPVAPT
jgi:hypothetical protein